MYAIRSYYDLESGALTVGATGLPVSRLLGFLVRRMLPARGAELLQFQLLGHRLLVPGGRVVPALAFRNNFV